MNNSALQTSASNDIFSSTFLMGNVGAPFVIGMAVGYFAKKMLRIALFVGGGIVVALFVCESYGIVQLDDMLLMDAANAATDATKQTGSLLMDRMTRITSAGVSGTAGFLMGLKLG
jgi:uncharacterized membrane protein (Fun14 family)